MRVAIRAATASDAPAIAGLLDQLGYPTDAAMVKARLARMLGQPGQSVLVAESDGLVVGLVTVIVRHVISADAPFARLAALIVDQRWRGSGVGRALVEAAELIARRAGCDLIEVTSSDHRRGAHAFYSRLGYRERPRRFVKPV